MEIFIVKAGVYGENIVGSGSVSGAIISGISGVFQDRIEVPILDAATGVFDTIIVSGDATISGNTTVSGNSLISGDLTVEGNTNISGSLVVTGQDNFRKWIISR